MEKILNNDEKIRRAEQIYAQRRGYDTQIDCEEPKGSGVYKTFFKLLLLLNIIIVVFCIQNSNQIFKDEFLEKFNNCSNIINSKINNWIKELKDNQNINEENKIDEENIVEESTKTENISTINEENVDIKDESIEEKIKNNYKLIKPIEGTVTSLFGDRESIYQNVSGFHKGIDIGAVSGTVIRASLEGIVIQVSSEGDYRKSHKNRKR